jgi:two-component system response regulator FixJ
MSCVEHKVVAVVDDDDAVRDSLQLLLEVVGHRTEGFASAAELLQTNLRRVACMLLDHHMPDMTGLELAARLRADGVMIPILLITGMLSPGIAAQAGELGIAGVVEKPPSEEEVLSFIGDYWNKDAG